MKINWKSGECRVKILEVGLIGPLVHMGRSTAKETRAAREQALKVIFNLSFLAGIYNKPLEKIKQKKKRKQKEIRKWRRGVTDNCV